MPTNPFDVDQLNGVTFDIPTLAYYDTQSFVGYPEGSELTLYYVPTGNYYSEAPRNPGTITVVNGTYAAGYIHRLGYYVFPTFGEITFSDVTDIHSNPIHYWIHAFTSGGLAISNYEFVSFANSFIPDINGVGGSGLRAGRFLFNYGFGENGPVFPLTLNTDPSVYQAPPVCFAENTQIATPGGSVAVEDLGEGDLVLTASGVERAVKWIGQTLVRPASRAVPDQAYPVRVAAHAFGADMPMREVRLSPGHAVLVEGVLVPVGLLINGATIVREIVDMVRYFHVELDTHDVLLAEGLPCESYFDDGNRSSFANAGRFAELDARLDPRSWDAACAPMVAAGPQLAQIRHGLQVQAEANGWARTEVAALTIMAEGVAVTPLHAVGNRHWFALPACQTATLRSNAGILGHILPGVDDRRTLGVAVSELRVDGVRIPLDAAMFGAGFHALEHVADKGEGADAGAGTAKGWRWTDGAATLALDAAEPVMIEVSLAMVAPTWVRHAPVLRAVA